MKEESKTILLKEYHDNPQGVVAWLTKNVNNKELLEELKADYPKLSIVGEMLYWLDKGLVDYPKCPVCGKDITTFASRHYPGHCSCRCTQLDKAVRDKNKKTCLERYGVDNAGKSKEIKEKQKQTMLSKYGIDNIFKDKDYIKSCNMKKLGVSNCAKLPETIEKRKETLERKYGVNCGFKLAGEFSKSKGELDLFNYIHSIYPSAISGDRTAIEPLELDIFIPELKVGIEYDGDYWHSLPNMKRRDNLKLNICTKKGIKLIRVLESDWIKNKDKIKCNILKEIKDE